MNSLMLASFGSIMMNVLYVIIAIVVLLTMVLIHELGHYIVGRKLGFKITEFSIGFGKALWQKTNKRGELISFRIFPLGGYCAFLGETDDDEPKKDAKEQENKEEIDENAKNLASSNEQNEQQPAHEYKYNKKGRVIYEEDGRFNNMRPWKRILVYFAGVTFNFLSAFVFSIIFLAVGAYDGYKLTPSDASYTINYYSVESAVAGDPIGTLDNNTEYLVYAINGQNINYAQSKTLATLVSDDATQITLTVSINGGEKQDIVLKKAEYAVKKDDGSFENQMIFGITYQSVNISYGFGEIMRDFIPFTFHLAFMVLEAFWWIISGQIAVNQLGGPISTISQMTMVASYGLANFLYLLPLLAANLAIFNILPIPGLDGAHVIFTSIEWARGKPIKRDVENAIHGWGILLLFAFVIIIDIVHLITV